MKPIRLDWFKQELNKLTKGVDEEVDNIVFIKFKVIKLLNILRAEIEYGTGEVILFKNDYKLCEMHMEELIDDLINKECLRELLTKRATRAEYV